MFKPNINNDNSELELSVCDEFVPMEYQKPSKGSLTVYERMQLNAESRKLQRMKEKFQRKIKMHRDSAPNLIKVPDSPERHTKRELDNQMSD